MAKYVGVWIDHKRAVIVELDGEAESIKELASNVGGRPRYHGRSDVQDGSAEDQRDNRYAGLLEKYYDQVVALTRDAEAILVLGPGEAKGELADDLRRSGLGGRIVAVEAADKLTDRQIAARVRQTFGK